MTQMKAELSPSLTPVYTLDTAEGTTTVKNVRAFFAPMQEAASTREGSVVATPAMVFTRIGKKEA